MNGIQQQMEKHFLSSIQVQEKKSVKLKKALEYESLYVLHWFIIYCDFQADVDKTVEAAQTAFDIESPWHKLDPPSFSQHKSICRKWKHLTMVN